MKTFDDCRPMQAWCHEQRRTGDRIGIVPTMGALHAGHLSLVRQAHNENERCVATIFVNPKQFSASEDLDQYPRPLERDLALLKEEGVDAVFLPSNESMYPSGFSTFVQPPAVANSLEGDRRPSHFQGVTTVVMKLLQIIPADAGYFGRKDFQQLRVIEHMARDLNVLTRIVGCEIIRESDGLAMSSRNQYLSKDDRQRALCLSRALTIASEAFKRGERETRILSECMHSELAGCDEIDYAVVVDADSLEPIEIIQRDSVALLAARVGTTRLIDNAVLAI